MTVAYRNTNTDDVYVYDEPNAELDARPNFVRVDPGTVQIGADARAAAARAAAQTDMVEAAHYHRAKATKTVERPDVAAAGTGVQATPTAAAYNPGGSNEQVGVLSRPDLKNPDAVARDTLAARDAREREQAGGGEGVLARGGHDQPAPGRTPGVVSGVDAKASRSTRDLSDDEIADDGDGQDSGDTDGDTDGKAAAKTAGRRTRK